MTSALFLGNMLRARKYRFALCFRVLSNQYVERSAYANVFKFKREEMFWESQSNIQMLPLVSGRHVHLESLRGLQHGVSILNTIMFSDILCRITRVGNVAHPRNFGTLLVYDISISGLSLLNDKRSYFSLGRNFRDIN